MSRTAHHAPYRHRDREIGSREWHVTRSMYRAGRPGPCGWVHQHVASECPGRDHAAGEPSRAARTGHRLTDLRYSAAVLASAAARPVPRQVIRRFAIYDYDRAYDRPGISEHRQQLERQARAQARADLHAAARTANSLLRLPAPHQANPGADDPRLDGIQDPPPYRPRGAAW
jgi:hypothetical protein